MAIVGLAATGVDPIHTSIYSSAASETDTYAEFSLAQAAAFFRGCWKGLSPQAGSVDKTRSMLRTAAIFAITLICSWSIPTRGNPGQDLKGIPLEQVIRELEKTLVDSQAQIVKRGLPRIRSIDVSLRTLFRREAAGAGHIGVYSLDMPYDSERSQVVNLSLARASDQTRYDTASSADSSPHLVDNLVALAHASLSGQARNAGIRLEAISTGLSFVLLRAGARGTFELVPVSPDLKQSLEDRAVHDLSVEFSPGSAG
ncbi:MAG: hypothetical protein GY725_07120 [bacterium]|nr:hypothetical protein [bacterium]